MHEDHAGPLRIRLETHSIKPDSDGPIKLIIISDDVIIKRWDLTPGQAESSAKLIVEDLRGHLTEEHAQLLYERILRAAAVVYAMRN